MATVRKNCFSFRINGYKNVHTTVARRKTDEKIDRKYFGLLHTRLL